LTVARTTGTGSLTFPLGLVEVMLIVLGVEPRGVESLTSAVQRRCDDTKWVSLRSIDDRRSVYVSQVPDLRGLEDVAERRWLSARLVSGWCQISRGLLYSVAVAYATLTKSPPRRSYHSLLPVRRWSRLAWRTRQVAQTMCLAVYHRPLPRGSKSPWSLARRLPLWSSSPRCARVG
jgi:hypothetical protein